MNGVRDNENVRTDNDNRIRSRIVCVSLFIFQYFFRLRKLPEYTVHTHWRWERKGACILGAVYSV